MNTPLAEANIRSRWMQFLGSESSVLHRLASMEWGAGLPDGLGDRQEEYRQGGTAVTVCGRKGVMWMPGMGSRLDAPRCRQCCKGVGIPPGYGAPFNNGARYKDWPEGYYLPEQWMCDA
jgi:hypothetical protein